jgi:hypothetical protein
MALWVEPEVVVSWTELSRIGNASEDVDEVAECPEVDTDRVDEPGCIGWVPEDKQRQGNADEQQILTGNVSRLLGSNTTNSPMSLTKCSIEMPCCGRARTVCSYSGLYKSSNIEEFDGGIEEGNESRR